MIFNKIYKNDTGLIVKFIEYKESGTFEGKVLSKGKSSYKVGEIVSDLIVSCFKTEIVDREEMLKLGEGVIVPHTLSMYIDNTNGLLKASDISFAFFKDKDIIDRYNKLDKFNMDVDSLSMFATTANRLLQMAIINVKDYCNVNSMDINEHIKEYTVNSIDAFISKEQINNRNIVLCKSELNKPLVDGVFSPNIFNVLLSKSDINIEFIKNNLNLKTQKDLDNFNILFYILNGYKL